MSAFQVGDEVVLTAAVQEVQDENDFEAEPNSPWNSLKPGATGVIRVVQGDSGEQLWVEIAGNDPMDFFPARDRAFTEIIFGKNAHYWPLTPAQVEKVNA